MNDDFTDLENELRCLRPRTSSQQLEDRIGMLLRQPAPRCAPVAWWQRLGFNRPLAALGWGLVSPALTATAAVIVIHLAQAERIPASPVSHPSYGTNGMAMSDPGSAANGLARNPTLKPTQATNVVYQTMDEGVVLDGGQEPVHRVRYRSADLVQWRNPSTGARWEVSYPREDVRLVPVEAD